jgi:PEGA domain-containing protein
VVSRSRRGANAFAVVLVVAQVVSVAHRAAAESAETEAEREFRTGYRALQAGNCADALVHYRRSLELVQRPRTLFNIATCEEDLGQQAAAWRDYQSFLGLAEERDAAIVVEARVRIEALRKRLRGQLLVDSSPGGASVSVDGERQGRGPTPVTLSLEPGRHVVRVAMAGAVAVERIVDVAPEDQASLHVELALSSSISIRTDPADAIIEPREEGTTAIGRLEMSVMPGRHAYVIRRKGYRDEHVEIDAVAGRTHDVRINLRPAPATSTLVVTGAADATLTIDGKPTSPSLLPAPRELPVGGHEIAIQRGGRVVWRRGLQFSPGEIVTLDVDLPRSSTRRALTWGIGGFGLASITAGGIVGTLALRDVTSERLDVHDRGKTRALVADGLFVAGAAALVVAWRLMRSDTASAQVRRENGAP